MRSADRSRPGEGLAHAITIRPTTGWAALNLVELWRYRELLYFLIWRDLKIRYRQTAIGALWALLQPLGLVLIFTLVLGRVPGLAPEGIPYSLFALAGLVPWTLNSQAVLGASASVVEAANVVQKVYFPRLLLPFGAASAYLLDFAIALALMAVLLTVSGYWVSLSWLWLVPLSILVFGIAAGAGIWLAAVNVRYRDVKHAVPFVIQLWFFASPIVYSAAIVPEDLWLLYHLNPMAGAVEGFRWVLFGGTQEPPVAAAVVASVVTAVVLLTGLAYFRRTERTFADVI